MLKVRKDTNNRGCREPASGKCPSKCKSNRQRQWVGNRDSSSSSRMLRLSLLTNHKLWAPCVPPRIQKNRVQHIIFSSMRNVNTGEAYICRASEGPVINTVIRFWTLGEYSPQKAVCFYHSGRIIFLVKSDTQWKLILKHMLSKVLWMFKDTDVQLQITVRLIPWYSEVVKIHQAAE